MNPRLICAVLGVLGGCATTHRPSAVDVASLVASTAAIAIDWRQTRGAAASGWSDGRVEIGTAAMAIGSYPSAGAVDGYFVATIGLNAMLWAMLPRNWRSIIPGVVIGAETYTVIGNIPNTGL